MCNKYIYIYIYMSHIYRYVISISISIDLKDVPTTKETEEVGFQTLTELSRQRDPGRQDLDEISDTEVVRCRNSTLTSLTTSKSIWEYLMNISWYSWMWAWKFEMVLGYSNHPCFCLNSGLNVARLAGRCEVERACMFTLVYIYPTLWIPLVI